MMKREVYNLIIRYSIIIIVGLGNLFLFYKLFTPITAQATGFILNLFSNTLISGNFLFSKSFAIELIPACIAGSAYYLLVILNLSTPNIKLFRRINLLLFTFVLFFGFNVLRIVTLAIFSNTSAFEFIHLILWYLLSTIFVVFIWILAIKVFGIKDIPIYSDVQKVLEEIKSN